MSAWSICLTKTTSIWATRPTSLRLQRAGGSPPSGFRATQALVDMGVKLIVVACNSATGAALSQLQASFSTPIVGVVMPGARAAFQATRVRRIGIMATEATVRSDAYQSALRSLDAGLEVSAVACPRLAPLIQKGDVFSEEVEGLRGNVCSR